MLNNIKKINKIIEPYYLLIIMIAFFLAGIISIYKLLFSPPDLLVKVEKETINYPATINDKYLEVYSYIQDSTKNSDIKEKSLDVYRYLIKTKHYRHLEIINNTNKTIKSINIRISNVKSLNSWAVSSSYLLEDEKDKVLKNILFQENSGIIYLKDAVNLPPNGDLYFYLWGEFLDFDWSENLMVDYDGGGAKIEYSKSYSGYKAVVADYFFEIMFFLILTFAFVYILQISKYANTKKDNS